MTGSGYGLNTGEMGSVAGKIDAIKGHVTESAQDVGKTTVEAKDFGRAHTQAGGPFTELLTGLSTMVTAQATAMTGYTKRMRDATSAYDATEGQNSWARPRTAASSAARVRRTPTRSSTRARRP